MPGLNLGIIKDLILPLPPLELQQKFRRFIAATTASRSDFESSQEGTENLFNSLQQHAFNGKLDLSRLILGSTADTFLAARAPDPPTQSIEIKVVRRFLHSPPNIEASLQALDNVISNGESIAWSAEYFKYRILASEPAPFSFGNLMRMAETVFDEPPPYEEIRNIIMDLLGQDGKPAILRQRFDLNDVFEKDSTGKEKISYESRKEMVFEPMP